MVGFPDLALEQSIEFLAVGLSDTQRNRFVKEQRPRAGQPQGGPVAQAEGGRGGDVEGKVLGGEWV
ncbi:hypothetical protein [Streptomyces sp. NPDC059783]|uniref:hypothetical protein n=1 Tax=Streptomyces sp. NPDC059783 TaxID=3346944 RepID=UPI00365BCEA9